MAGLIALGAWQLVGSPANAHRPMSLAATPSTSTAGESASASADPSADPSAEPSVIPATAPARSQLPPGPVSARRSSPQPFVPSPPLYHFCEPMDLELTTTTDAPVYAVGQPVHVLNHLRNQFSYTCNSVRSDACGENVSIQSRADPKANWSTFMILPSGKPGCPLGTATTYASLAPGAILTVDVTWDQRVAACNPYCNSQTKQAPWGGYDVEGNYFKHSSPASFAVGSWGTPSPSSPSPGPGARAAYLGMAVLNWWLTSPAPISAPAGAGRGR